MAVEFHARNVWRFQCEAGCSALTDFRVVCFTLKTPRVLRWVPTHVNVQGRSSSLLQTLRCVHARENVRYVATSSRWVRQQATQAPLRTSRLNQRHAAGT